jgi:hypothetical protein
MEKKTNLSEQVVLGQRAPERERRHCAALGTNALVVHFGYYPQTEALLKYTNLLETYEELAQEVTGQHLLQMHLHD